VRDEPLSVVVLDDAFLTAAQLAAVCAVHVDWVTTHVDDGVLTVTAIVGTEWLFSARDLQRARRIRHLERAFDAGPELAALVADLLEEVGTLRARLRAAGLE
jgi:chaperone modulatory protein CbpM